VNEARLLLAAVRQGDCTPPGGEGARPEHDAQTPPAEPSQGPRRSTVLRREHEISGSGPAYGSDIAAVGTAGDVADTSKFLPEAPETLDETGLDEVQLSALILKYLLSTPVASGATISRQLALPFPIVAQQILLLKAERLVAVKSASQLQDLVYELTPPGKEQALSHLDRCTYCGPAPVPLDHYAKSVSAQSLSRCTPTFRDLQRAFADITLSDEMLLRLARAIYYGKGLFLHGLPGNGKTSMAERVTKAYGQTIWIPQTISAFGEIIQLYDPSLHEEVPLASGKSVAPGRQMDRRWVRIRRPTIVVGGELTLDNLEITVRAESGLSEAPIQLKSNCGTLVVDDFGRQRISPTDLLNRWIVPLEKRYDFLNLKNGRKTRVPFDQFVVFSTNLEPKDLVDEAFLRRIPYKIEAQNPSEAEFRELFLSTAQRMGISVCPDALEHLIDQHYRSSGRSFRFCHPRDLLHQVSVYCAVLGAAPTMTREAVDAAAGDYFCVF